MTLIFFIYMSLKVACHAAFNLLISVFTTRVPACPHILNDLSLTTSPSLRTGTPFITASNLFGSSTSTTNLVLLSENRRVSSGRPPERVILIPNPPAKDISASAIESPPSEQSWQDLTRPFDMPPLRVVMRRLPSCTATLGTELPTNPLIL